MMDYDLIITVVNRGYADMVMDAAKSAGAKGGTLISGRGTAGDAEKFYNISVTPEKELVFIVCEHSARHEIMDVISKKAGLNTIGQGIVFSVPVEEQFGLNKN